MMRDKIELIRFPAKFVFSAIALLVMILTPVYALASSNILFIMDASGSMNGKIGSEIKMTVAKRVLSDLLNEIPEDSKVGLMAYGHTVSKEKAGACEDIAILSSIGQESPKALSTKVNGLRPMGMTPIASTLKKSVEAFKGVQGGDNHIVLISDGLETCGKDPCGAARALSEANIKAQVHVVGFDVGAREAKELACIPKMGNGKYFRANNTAELKQAIADVKQVTHVAEAVEPPPVVETLPPIEEPKVIDAPQVAEAPSPPAPKEYKEVWRDDFDGEELADHWEVINPDPDSFIVENGVLIMVASEAQPIQQNDKLSNILRLNKPLPKGDWTATMSFIPELSTLRERYILGLYTDKDKMLTATAGNIQHCCNYFSSFVSANKLSKGKNTGFTVPVLNSPSGMPSIGGSIATVSEWTKKNLQRIQVRIEKKGRAYVISSKVEGDTTTAGGKKPEWVYAQKLTSLRPPGDSLAIAFTQEKFTHGSYQIKGGESIMTIEWVKIEVPN
ncbi:MAG: vWA domain-containing protein [Nitrospinales bacterium]